MLKLTKASLRPSKRGSCHPTITRRGDEGEWRVPSLIQRESRRKEELPTVFAERTNVDTEGKGKKQKGLRDPVLKHILITGRYPQLSGLRDEQPPKSHSRNANLPRQTQGTHRSEPQGIP